MFKQKCYLIFKNRLPRYSCCPLSCQGPEDPSAKC